MKVKTHVARHTHDNGKSHEHEVRTGNIEHTHHPTYNPVRRGLNGARRATRGDWGAGTAPGVAQ